MSDGMKAHIMQPNRTIIISREGDSFHYKDHIGDVDVDLSEHLGEQTEWEEKEKNPILHVKVSRLILKKNKYFFFKVPKVKVGIIRTSGKFGHTCVNSVNPDETVPYEPSQQDFHCLLSQIR